MTDPASGDFYVQYAAALTAFLESKAEASLAVGHELGRRALSERMSMLDIIENHSRLVQQIEKGTPGDSAAPLQFLLQTLAAFDVATRGFLDGTRRYEQQRARADDLADRDEFRDALVNSLQEGFFVADHTGAIVEINDAFSEITGYGPAELPYQPPYPWVTDIRFRGQREAVCAPRRRQDHHRDVDPAPRRIRSMGGAVHQRRDDAGRRPPRLRGNHPRYHRDARRGGA